MKKLLVLMLVGGLCALGCGKETPRSTGGRSTTKDTGAGRDTGLKDTGKKAPPLKEAKVELKTGEEAEVAKGKKTTATIHIKRTAYEGDVTLQFKPKADSGLTIKEVTVPAGEDSAKVEIDATKAKEGTSAEVPVTLKGGKEATGEGMLKVTVK